jgi:hypothetical protein
MNNQTLTNPKYPIYIVSKGRWDSRLTHKALFLMRVPHYVVIEEQEYNNYLEFIDKKYLLVLDKKFQREYDTFDALGDSKSKGPGPARNFAWEHSISTGNTSHWVMDDNIKSFHRFNKNLKVPVGDGTIIRCMEDFCDRYTNIAMAGPQYFMFVARKTKLPPFVINTRIYSCNLIRNNTPFRWRGRYNEDTDLSLRILKHRLCTVQFNAFLQYKMPTQLVKGGNTEAFYAKEGTKPKSEMLYQMHPDVTKLVVKFKRAHHYVDYSRFKKTRLIRKPDLELLNQTNNYGMELRSK